MSWFFTVIIIAFTWGIAHVLIKKGFAHLSPLQSYALDTFVALFIWIPYGILAGGKLTDITPVFLGIFLFLGIAYAGYYYVVEKGPVSIVIPIFSASPIVTVLLSYVFLGERLGPVQFIAICATILGVIMTSLPAKKERKVPETWVLLALFLTIVWGLENILVKYAVDHIGNATSMILLTFGQIGAVALWRLISPQKQIVPQIPKRYFLPTLIGVILLNGGTIAYMIAMEQSLASLVGPLSNAYVVVTVLFSAFYLREKIRPIQYLGIALTTLGVILVSIP
mgnify:CR=1 FL=1